MPLQGSYTPSYSTTAFASSYWVIGDVNINNMQKLATFEICGFENSSGYLANMPAFKILRFTAADPLEVLAESYTWDGTTTIVSSSIPTDLSVGDWIKEMASDNLFEVSVISGSNVTILNPDSLTIPNTTASSDPAEKSADPLYFKYFGTHELAKVDKGPVAQSEQFLLDNESDFSGFTVV